MHTAPFSLGSDNHAGVHPAIMQAMVAVAEGDSPAYGIDALTQQAQAVFAEELGACASHFVFNGTAANVLCLGSMLAPHRTVICCSTAHIHVDECGAPERHLGCKLQVVPSHAGKLIPADVQRCLIRAHDQHFAAPQVLSISQPTELGTVYTLEELRTLAQLCRAQGLLLHMDGARLVGAAAAMGVPLRALCADVGVDVLSFGGTKNGLMFGEAVVFFRQDLAELFAFRRKQGLQLASKMRYISAQFLALFADDLWRKAAAHANAMAAYLAEGLRACPAVRVVYPVQTNAVFVAIPRAFLKPLRRAAFFYVWDEHSCASGPIVRLMTHFATRRADLDLFLTCLADLAQHHHGSATRQASAAVPGRAQRM